MQSIGGKRPEFGGLGGRKYRIREVVELSGVPAPTLRSWERRYGIPQPVRTSTAHRLYQEKDLRLIEAMKELTASGVTAAQAARQVKEMIASEAPTISGQPYPDGSFEDWVRELVERTRLLDATGLRNLMRSLVEVAKPLVVYEQILEPVLHRIGLLWENDEINIAHEHFFSAEIENVLHELLQTARPPDPMAKMVLACVAGEQHMFGIYGVAIRVAGWGISPELLGADTPPQALSHARIALQPDLIGLSTYNAVSPAQAEYLAASYDEAAGNVPWIVGGTGAESWRQAIEKTRRGRVVTGVETLKQSIIDLRR